MVAATPAGGLLDDASSHFAIGGQSILVDLELVRVKGAEESGYLLPELPQDLLVPCPALLSNLANTVPGQGCAGASQIRLVVNDGDIKQPSHR